MAGGKFFALVDELAASEQRLDALAEPLLEKLVATEAEAKIAVEAKHAKIDAARDYIKRIGGITQQLGEGGNGGPSLQGGLSTSSDQTPSETDSISTETKE